MECQTGERQSDFRIWHKCEVPKIRYSADVGAKGDIVPSRRALRRLLPWLVLTPPSAFTNCCPGTGTGKTLLLKPRKAQGPPVQIRSARWPSPDAYVEMIPTDDRAAKC